MPAAGNVADTPLGLYVHVPFCQRRCGYCSFATTAVGDHLDPSVAEGFVNSAATEIGLADAALGTDRPPLTSVFFGGGTPTMLDGAHVGTLLDLVRQRFEVGPDLEVTVESNPDSLTDGQLQRLVEHGVTRMSFGLQSIRPSVLALLDRTHQPERALIAVEQALAAGTAHVSVDLIHGTPGEGPEDWTASLAAAVDSGADHVSAYALSIEPGTKLAARVRTGELPTPSDDEAAERYATADDTLSAAGFDWYELSNWSRSPEARSRHNLLYWRNHHWWGIGPSAHSHVAGRRWWNHRGLDQWADALAGGRTPDAGSEVPDADERSVESVMLGIRLAEGIELGTIPRPSAVRALVDDGLVCMTDDRVVLTLRGRLLADHVIRSLI